MRQWRRRNRNTFARGLGGKSLGRRYADNLPKTVNSAFNAIVAHHEEKKKFIAGGSSRFRVMKAWSKLINAIDVLGE